MSIITRAGVEFDTAKLPEASLNALIGRGLTHVLGSELSSKVIGWKERFAKENSRQPNEDEVAAYKSEAFAGYVASINEGTLGQGASRGPAIDPEDAEVERLAWAEVVAMLKAHNIKATGKGDERVWTFADGSTRTKDAMLEKHLANAGKDGTVNEERLRKAAKKNLAAKAKAKDTAKAEPLAL